MNEEKTSPFETPYDAPPLPSGSGVQQMAKDATNTAKTEIEKLKGAAQEQGGAAIEQIKTAAQSAASQAQEAGRNFIDEQKDNLIQKVDQYTEALRGASERLSGEGNMLAAPAQKAADRLEQMSGYLRENQLPDVLDDLESYARRKPEVVFGGLFFIGLAAARFFKASRKRSRNGTAAAEANADSPQFPVGVRGPELPPTLAPSQSGASSPQSTALTSSTP